MVVMGWSTTAARSVRLVVVVAVVLWRVETAASAVRLLRLLLAGETNTSTAVLLLMRELRVRLLPVV